MSVNESTLRRRLHRLGYNLQRCRSRNPRVADYGTYRIFDPSCNVVVAGSWGIYNYGLGLPAIAAFVDEYRERQLAAAAKQREQVRLTAGLPFDIDATMLLLEFSVSVSARKQAPEHGKALATRLVEPDELTATWAS